MPPEPNPFVVVGGDAAGLSAASKLRREAPEREVVVFEKGQWVSFAHCGMPYYVKGEIESLTDMLSLRPEDVEERGIDLRRGHEVVDVDTASKTVTVRAGDDQFEQPYCDLLVATGARALEGPFDLSAVGAFTLHHMDSAAAIRAFLTPPDEFSLDAIGGGPYVDEARVESYGALDTPASVAVVGGGYVGIEMAEALRAHDLEVHLFQRSGHVLPPFGEAVAERVETHLAEQGVSVHTGAPVESIQVDDASDDDADDGSTADGGRVSGVRYDGETLPVEMAVVGVGVRPSVDFLDGVLDHGAGGAVAVDAYGRSSEPDVYAAGDCAEASHVVSGEQVWIPLGLTANRAGRAVGATVGGDPTPVGGVAGTAVVKAFDLEAGRSGLLPDAAREAGFDPVAETITAGSRSGYYPGGAETTVTLVADRDSKRLLGGTIAGEDRAAIRIDTVATALEAGMTVPELERADLAYAPPFSPVWDPVLVAAKVLNGRL